MPPKKPPAQAGKFKPLKRPSKGGRAEPSSSAAAARSASSSSSAAPGSRSESRGRQDGDRRGSGGAGRGRSFSPKDRGRGGGGRDGRGRGRGRGGRGGRFIVPTGQAFFTGAAAARSDASGSGGGPGQEGMAYVPKVSAGTDGAVFMPGSKSSRASLGTSKNRVAMSAAESMAAAARAKQGEGEEIIVSEMLDLDDADEDGGKKRSVLDGPSNSRFDGMPSLFDNEEKEEVVPDHHGISDVFMYDSDSSAEERRTRRRKDHGYSGGGFRMPPAQLPFPSAPGRPTMYDCQDALLKSEEEKKMDDTVAATSTLKLTDPPLQSPFLDLESVSEEQKRQESNSWFLMKFPTRLPHMDTSSSSANAEGADNDDDDDVKNKQSGEGLDTKSSVAKVPAAEEGNAAALAAGASSNSALGYDDTLKDNAAGRYGRIVVRKSGKTELIIGGGKGEGPEVRLLLHEGLQCGFRQEAVCINPEEATFVSMGDVGKSLIVTPDIEGAFEFS